MTPGLRTTSSRPNFKSEPLYLEGGDPDVCLTVRLLPPNLGREGFLEQAKFHSDVLKTRPFGLLYEHGTRDTKPFEQPIFSVAHVQFATASLASQAKEQLDGRSFIEPETEDNMACQCVKSVVGRIYVGPVADSSKISHGGLFEAFCKLREEKLGHAMLRELLEVPKTKLKRSRKLKTKANAVKEKVESGETTAKPEPLTNKSKSFKKARKAEKEKKLERKKNLDERKKNLDEKKNMDEKIKNDKLNVGNSLVQAPAKSGEGPEGNKKKKKKKKRKASGDKPEKGTKENVGNAKPDAVIDNFNAKSKFITSQNPKPEGSEPGSKKPKRQRKRKNQSKEGSGVKSDKPAPSRT